MGTYNTHYLLLVAVCLHSFHLHFSFIFCSVMHGISLQKGLGTMNEFKAIRKSFGSPYLTQEEMAIFLGVSPQTVRNWEQSIRVPIGIVPRLYTCIACGHVGVVVGFVERMITERCEQLKDLEHIQAILVKLTTAGYFTRNEFSGLVAQLFSYQEKFFSKDELDSVGFRILPELVK